MIAVIDTNVVVNACRHKLDHLGVLMAIREESCHFVGLDAESSILREYQKNCGDSEFFRAWFAEVVNIGARVQFVPGRLDRSRAMKLTELGFHEPTDQVYVAVALKTDRYIVTEDSDFGHTARKGEAKTPLFEYLTDDLGLTIDDATEARRRLREPT